MIRCVGNMWDVYNKSNLFCFTSNGVINGKNELVMGAGIARQVKERFPASPVWFGAMLKKHRETENVEDYGFYLPDFWPHQKIAPFQTKRHWKSPASLDLIKTSTEMLMMFANEYPNMRIDLNMPGVGLGGLEVRQVLPVVEKLPNNVHVWMYK